MKLKIIRFFLLLTVVCSFSESCLAEELGGTDLQLVERLKTICEGRKGRAPLSHKNEKELMLNTVRKVNIGNRTSTVDLLISMAQGYKFLDFVLWKHIETLGVLTPEQSVQLSSLINRLGEVKNGPSDKLRLALGLAKIAPNEWSKVEKYLTNFLESKPYEDIFIFLEAGLRKIDGKEMEDFARIVTAPYTPNTPICRNLKTFTYGSVKLLVESPPGERERFYKLFRDMCNRDPIIRGYPQSGFFCSHGSPSDILKKIEKGDRLFVLELLCDLNNPWFLENLHVLQIVPDNAVRQDIVEGAKRLFGRGLEELSKYPSKEERLEAVNLTIIIVNRIFKGKGRDPEKTSIIEAPLKYLRDFPVEERTPVTGFVINSLGKYISLNLDVCYAFRSVFWEGWLIGAPDRRKRTISEAETLLTLAETYFRLEGARVADLSYLFDGIDANKGSDMEKRLMGLAKELQSVFPQKTKGDLGRMGKVLKAAQYVSTGKLVEFIKKIQSTYPQANGDDFCTVAEELAKWKSKGGQLSGSSSALGDFRALTPFLKFFNPAQAG